MKLVIVKNTHIELPEYQIGDCEKLEKSLSIWDPECHKLLPIGYRYEMETETLYLPRGIDINFVARMTNRKIEKYRDRYVGEKATIRLDCGPRDEDQVKGINFLIGDGEFEYTKGYSQKVLTLATGVGKTYVTIAALSVIRRKAIIITHLNRISDQWLTSISDFTHVNDDDVYVIRGSKDMTKLIELSKKGKNPYKIFFVNHQTLNRYQNKYGFLSLDEFMTTLGIGVKVYDEAHLKFMNTLNIDYSTNVPINFYLTATFQRSDFRQQKVFELCYRNVVKFGKTVAEHRRKYINYLTVKYNSNPSMQDRASMKTFRGFNVQKYSKYMVEQQEFFDTLYFLTDQFVEFEGSILILFSSIEVCDDMKKELQKKYPNENVTVLHSKINKKDVESAKEGSIIISTPQSAGTGVDIKGLRYCINTVSYSSEVTADQVSGRLREYNSEVFSIYVETLDIGFPQVVNMYKRHKGAIIKKAAKVIDVDRTKK